MSFDSMNLAVNELKNTNIKKRQSGMLLFSVVTFGNQAPILREVAKFAYQWSI